MGGKYKKLLIFFISISILANIAIVKAQTSNEISFTDNNLKKALCKYYKWKRTFTKEDASNLSNEQDLLILENSRISDLEGLQYFESTSNIYLGGNKLKNLRPLSKLSELVLLDISNNSIKGKELQDDFNSMGKIGYLSDLILNNNGLTNISFLKKIGNIANFQSIEMKNNKISDISILIGAKNLDHLDLSNNRITDVTPLAKLDNLTFYLDLRDNCILDYKPIKPLLDVMYDDVGNENGIPRYDFYTNPVNFKLNGKRIHFPHLTTYYKYQPYAEAIPLFEALGGSAKYNKKTGTLTCRYNDKELVMKDFSTECKLNGKKKSLNYEMRRMQYDLAYVPVEDVCNILGLKYKIIKDRTFYQNGDYEEVTAPELVEIKSDQTGYTEDGDYFYKVINNHICIEKYNGLENNIVIPSHINGLPVTSIADGAFSDNKTIVSVEVPETIKMIGSSQGSGVFFNCTSLKNIKLNTGIENAFIGASAFGNCLSLTSITIPENYINIYDKAFSGCSSLQNVDWVTSSYADQELANSVFSGCKALKVVNLPGNLCSIGNFAFKDCTSLTSVNIPEGTEKIGEGAFEKDEALASVSIPSTMQEIGSSEEIDVSEGIGAFADCSNLSSVTLTVGKDYAFIGSRTFSNCESLTEITVPGNYMTIYPYAFENCKNLKSFVYLKGYTDYPYQLIDCYAFNECNALKVVSLSESLKTIESYAFKNCIQLEEILIPEGATKIGDGAFINNTSLKKVFIPSSTVEIGCSAFENCSSLIEATIQNGTRNAYLEEYTFKGCSSLETITIPGNYLTIDYEAFADCTNLKFVTYKKSKYSYARQIIGEYAFRDCINLETVSLPHTLMKIDSYAFEHCTSLKTIAIPEGVQRIGDGVFFEDNSLITVTLPSSLTVLGDASFFQCTRLKTVTIPTGTHKLSICDDVFLGCSSLTSVYVGENVKDNTAKNVFLGSNVKARVYTKNKTIIAQAKATGLKTYSPASNYIDGKSLFGTIAIQRTMEGGNTLIANLDAIAPINALVSYQWIIDDKVVSTTNTYTIKESDEGKKVTLNVSGENECIGRISSTIKIAN